MPETLIDGRYQILETLGTGGEARVSLARDTQTGDEVALRLPLRPAANADFPLPSSFHSNWVRLIARGLDPQIGPYHVLERLRGPTLAQLVHPSPLTPENWLRFVHQSLDAVAALHDAAWVHGDLNADNFLLADDTWKLLELPFLRFEPPVRRTSLFGSIHTLAPELFENAPADFPSDLYALGCLYYRAASGQYPHGGSTAAKIAIERLRFDPSPLAEKAPHLPAMQSRWVMTLLEREPQNRPQNAAAARQLLEK